jgi:D-threo-aldose 1-dehydrogenase
MTPCCGSVAVKGTGLTIARLGLGCARLFGGSEARTSIRLLEHALAAGFGHFDTAPSYAYGQSETLLGEVLGDVAGVTIATKVGLSTAGAPSQAGTYYRRFFRPLLARAPALKAALLKARERPAEQLSHAPRRVLGRDEIEASVAASLARLRRSQIDILLVHEPDQFVIDGALQERFEALRRGGTILAYGLGYGGMVTHEGAFGQVLQRGYDPAAPVPLASAAAATAAAPTAIYHGVVRHRGSLPAGEAVRAVLRSEPDAALLVSASSPSQIRDLARQVAQAAPRPVSTFHS